MASVTHYRIGFVQSNFTFSQVKSTLKLFLPSSLLWILTQFPIIYCPFLRIFLNMLGNYALTAVPSGNLLLLSLIWVLRGSVGSDTICLGFRRTRAGR